MSYRESVLRNGWYLLKTKCRAEIRAQNNLNHQGFDTYCPVIREKDAKDTLAPLFPSYLFVKLRNKDMPYFHKIRSTRGVSQIVHFNRVSHKLFSKGRLPKDELGTLLPSPIPNGDQLINQVERFISKYNQPTTERNLASIKFSEGDSVIYDNQLFRHLESTFVKGISKYRGIILIQFIESMRTEDGISKKVVARKKMEVPLKYLRGQN